MHMVCVKRENSNERIRGKEWGEWNNESTYKRIESLLKKYVVNTSWLPMSFSCSKLFSMTRIIKSIFLFKSIYKTYNQSLR